MDFLYSINEHTHTHLPTNDIADVMQYIFLTDVTGAWDEVP